MNVIANWFSRLKRRRAIKKYAKKLGPALKKNYGKSRYYTPGQIRTAASNTGLSYAYICFGYAIYMDKDSFDKLHQEIGEQCDYNAMRQDVADLCFSGDSSFSTSDAISYGGHTSDFSGGDGFAGDSGGGGE